MKGKIEGSVSNLETLSLDFAALDPFTDLPKKKKKKKSLATNSDLFQHVSCCLVIWV